MQFNRSYMLERFYESDASANGEFITGVLSTGIYCLPSCSARKPREENVRFFATEDEAQAAGLRACKRCRPDHFYRGFNPGLHFVKTLAEEIRNYPAAFANVNALVDRADVGATKLHALFREHYHTTPAHYLQRARINAACGLLQDPAANVTRVAFDVGYESLSAFYEHFGAWTGLRPTKYQALGEEHAFTIVLPDKYNVGYTLGRRGRNGESLSEKVGDSPPHPGPLPRGERGRRFKGGKLLTKAVVLLDVVALLHLTFGSGVVSIQIEGDEPLDPEYIRDAHAIAVRMLGLHTMPGAFESRMCEANGLRRLIHKSEGLHIPLTATLFEGITWSIVGQQVNLAFAHALERRLTELCGRRAGDFVASPTPEAVAQLDYADLRPYQFSQRKAEYLIDIARKLAAGEILESAREAPATEIKKELLSLRGIGPWSANYVMMRSLGFGDCVPLGDTGLTSALQTFFDLDYRPDKKQTASLMEQFSPHRSLATHYLWVYESPSP